MIFINTLQVQEAGSIHSWYYKGEKVIFDYIYCQHDDENNTWD